MSKLKMFSNEVDYVIAESPEEADEIWFDFTGERKEDYDDFEWTEEDPLKDFNFFGCIEDFDFFLPTKSDYENNGYEYGDIVDKEIKISRPIEVWIELHGKGFFASSEI